MFPSVIMNGPICIPYVPLLHAIKYSKRQWYKKQLNIFFQSQPNATSQDAWDWICKAVNELVDEMMPDWTNRYMNNVCSEVRGDIKRGFDEYPVYKLEKNNKKKVVDMIEFCLRGYTYDQIMDILESVSLRKDILHQNSSLYLHRYQL